MVQNIKQTTKVKFVKSVRFVKLVPLRVAFDFGFKVCDFIIERYVEALSRIRIIFTGVGMEQQLPTTFLIAVFELLMRIE